MSGTKLRRQIAWEAARLMYDRRESEYYRAKMKAARRICRGWVKPSDLPSNCEIRDQIQIFARLHEGDARDERLREMRVEDLSGSAGIYRLREELLDRVNVAARPVVVNDVLFREMLVQ